MNRHGLSVGMERSGSDFYMTVTALGKLTHADYAVITPVIESALAGVSEPNISALVDVREMEGWEPRAAWDDLRIGLRHGHEFERVALIGSKRWQEVAGTVGGWFIAGELRFFEEPADAIEWLTS